MSISLRPVQARSWNGRIVAGALAGVLAATLAGPAVMPVAAQTVSTAEPVHTISVDGTGRVKIAPDVADISLGVRIVRDRAGAASQEAAKAMAGVARALDEAGIAAEDIQTSMLTLNPVWSYDRDPAVITGYQAENIVTVVVRDPASIGALIDTVVAAGATSVDSISFRLEDTTAAEAQAREAAVLAARAKAETLATAAGVTVGDVMTISETSYSMPTPIYYGRAEASVAGDAMMTTPTYAGLAEIAVTVYIVYAIGE